MRPRQCLSCILAGMRGSCINKLSLKRESSHGLMVMFKLAVQAEAEEAWSGQARRLIEACCVSGTGAQWR